MTNLRERIEEILGNINVGNFQIGDQILGSLAGDDIISQATDQILQAVEIKLQDILSKFYNCDNPNCGKGAICNYCALRKDIESASPKYEKG